MNVTRAESRSVAKKGKREKVLGPVTVAKPALWGATLLLVIQGAMKMFLHA